jgi:hypothetical protein
VSEKLPGILQEIADIVGEAGALAIAARRGGTRVYIASSARLHEGYEQYWLIECVGIEAARKICSHFEVDGRGQRVEIPLYVGGTYRQLVRKIAERVHELDKEDNSSTQIARKVGISQRSVHRHRARHGRRKNDKQGRLL